MAQMVAKGRTDLRLASCLRCSANIVYGNDDVFDHHYVAGGSKEVDKAITCPCCGAVRFV